MSEVPKLKSAFHEELLEIEVKALRDERDRLREALEPFAAYAVHPQDGDPNTAWVRVTTKQYLAAQAAMTPAGQRLTPNEATE